MIYLSKKDKNNSGALRWVIARIRRFIPAIIGVSVINALLSVSYVVVALISREIIDSSDKNKLLISALILIGIVIAELLTSSLLSIINVRLNGKMTISLRNYMFSSLVHKKYAGLFDHHTGDLLNRFTSDIDQIVSGATGIIPSVIAMISKLIAGMVALFIMNPYLAAVILVLGVLLPMLGRTISKKYKYMHKEVQRTEGQARSFMQESFANVVVIKTFISETPILKKLNEYMQANLRMKIKRNFISAIITLCLQSFFTLGYYVVLIWGAAQLSVNRITYGTLNAYLQLFSQLRAPLQNVSGVLPQYYSLIASAERLIDLENIENEPTVIKSDELDRLRDTFSEINIDNVAFSYGDEVILRKCSFAVERGKITAIMGESGSGKSTLFKLFLGLYEPDGGSITFDGVTPINAATRGMFSYVPQGNMILSGTIRDNLTLCREDISEEQIEKATRAAVIYDFIQELPNGFDTVLSERGAGLSEGQIQRISIARALLFDTPILLFDESTSALDEQTETALLSNIKHMTDKTVIFITHRNTSVGVCDHIIHVENKKFTALK